MVVVDASALVALLLEGPPGPIRDRLRDVPMAAPQLIDLEVVSALRREVARGHLLIADADARVAVLQSLPLTRHPHTPLLPRVWELRYNLSAYDAAYVTLAEMLDAPLLTTDGRLARAPGIACDVQLLAT